MNKKQPQHTPKKRLSPLFTISFIMLAIAAVFIYKLFNPNFLSNTHSAEADAHNGSVSLRKVGTTNWLDQYLKQSGFKGTALIVKDGKVLLNNGYGYANRNNKINNTVNSKYLIGSITKIFTSTAFMQLEEKGVVHLNDPVSKYIPSFPHGHEITLYNLLTHTSGIPVRVETKAKLTPEQLIREIEKNSKTLAFQPGTNWLYNDANYCVLGYIIEKETKEPLSKYIQKHIFKPAGMTGAGFGASFYKNVYHSIGYKPSNNGNIYAASHPSFSQLLGCGDIYMTTEDMYKFDRALMEGKLMSAKNRQIVFKPFLHYYGMGWYQTSKGVYSHGVLAGFDTLNSMAPKKKEYVILMSNFYSRSIDTRKMKDDIYTYLDQVPNVSKQASVKTLAMSDQFTPTQVDSRLEQYLKTSGFSGTALIMKNGKSLINQGFGLQNRNEYIPNSVNTQYFIGSITKSFVSTAFMQLEEKGLVKVNDPVSKYIPSFPFGKKITIDDLLTHSSGIPLRDETSVNMTPNQLVKAIEKNTKHLMFKPGTGWFYNDVNYALVGYIVEKVSGQPLHQYIQEHIFNPANMTGAGFGDSFYQSPDHSVGYKQNSKGIWKKPGLPSFTQFYGCGDIYVTAEDMMKFDEAMKDGKLVSSKSRAMIFTPKFNSYGMGWYVTDQFVFSHGVVPGWNGINSYSPKNDEYVILLSNYQNAMNIKQIKDDIYTLLSEEKQTPANEVKGS
ncbi:serine hydrolase domain-containing protein [Heyndrickxia acidicola]|uniref:Serine hydrolase n=2 Tax=Heyndrickxia acidicola TaxID=209389 RepID=A0ABU6MAC5_9BACI|nr:serine hydrolase [Heyndrickxia acidicola]